MSEKKTRKLKLNLFDIGLIAVVVLVAAVFVGMKFMSEPAPVDPGAGLPVNMQTVRYVVELEQVHEQTADMVQPGQVIYERTKRECMGTVLDVTVNDATTLTKDEERGTFQFVEVPERYNVVMTVESKCTVKEDAIVLDSGLEVRAGTSVRVLGPGYYGAGYILSVERG
ncbi:MAG: DUF4330 family protein [Oscillospiraceae bacterium]|nr:DUF4330 family protein [Oscillospiraceae bacterium]